MGYFTRPGFEDDMNREIKFRGRRIDNGKWVYGSLIIAADGHFILENENYSVQFEEPDYHTQGMGCGLEDRDIVDRYEAMYHGWEKAVAKCAENYPEFVEVHPDTVGQYIGLKDKNVYEGDKLKITIKDGGPDQFIYGTVVWSEDALEWGIDFGDGMYPERLRTMKISKSSAQSTTRRTQNEHY